MWEDPDNCGWQHSLDWLYENGESELVSNHVHIGFSLPLTMGVNIGFSLPSTMGVNIGFSLPSTMGVNIGFSLPLTMTAIDCFKSLSP